MSSTPSVADIRKILGTYSVASVRNWLRRCELPHSASTRDELAERIHGLIKDSKLTRDGLQAAMIGIEEASSKRTFLYRIPNSDSARARIRKQLTDLGVVLAVDRVAASHPKRTPKLVYVIDTSHETRAKWTELHKRLTPDKKHRKWKEEYVPKIIVLIVDKKTGVIQLRCDHPDDEHEHVDINNNPTDDAFYRFFRERAENLVGHGFEPVDLRSSLEAVLKANPRIVRTSYAVDETEDGGHTKRAQKRKDRDVRDLAEWQLVMQNPMPRTFEEAPVRWLKEMSGGALHREVYSYIDSYIDAANGLVRFDADCYEDEIDYVLGRLT